MTARELAERLVREFDRMSTSGIEAALATILRAEGLGRYRSEEAAAEIKLAVLRELANRPPEELPFRLTEGGKRLVGKGRVGARDNSDTIWAKSVHGLAGQLLDALVTLNPDHFEVVCAASVKLAGARDMKALCTGDEGGVDFYGRLEVRPSSLQVPRGLAYTTILPKQLLVLGQAKRYALNAKIGRPTIQQFKGQIDDCIEKYEGNSCPPRHRVPDEYYYRGEPYLGVFMTTGSFTETATETISASGIVLVSGVQLAQFLAVNRVGITERNGALHFGRSDFADWVENQRLQITG